MSKAGFGSSGLDYKRRWDSARKELVPLGKDGAGRTSTTGEAILCHIATIDTTPGVVDSSPTNGRQPPNKVTVATASDDEMTQPLCCACHARVNQRDFHIPATYTFNFVISL